MKYFRLKDALESPDQKHSKLARLVKQLDSHQSTIKIVRFLLPEEEAKHCTSARVQGTTMYVSFDANAWATRFRFRSLEILRQMKTLSQYSHVDKIVVSTNRKVTVLHPE